MDKSEFLTVSQVAQRLQVSHVTITRWIQANAFPGVYRVNPDNPKSHFRIPVQDVINFEAKQRKGI